MNSVQEIILNLLKTIWWVFPLAALAAITKTNWFKGKHGEFKVKLLQFIYLNKNTYKTLHDITLQSKDGTTQIDHAIISKFGVFVIETKNYGGKIYGRFEDLTWTQKFYKTSNKFQNPIRQNYKHVATISENFGIPLRKIHSVVVFVGKSEFKTEVPENVTSTSTYIKYIKSKQDILLTDAEVDSIYEKIQQSRLKPSIKTNRQHVKNLNERHEKKIDKSISFSTCPLCQSKMVEREIKSGPKAGNKFLGCSKYPACKGIRPLPQKMLTRQST